MSGRHLLLLAALSGVVPAVAQEAGQSQEIRTAIVPAEITVGDVFRAAVRVRLPAGATLELPDTLAVPENIEAAGRRLVQEDTLPDGTRMVTAAYPLTAWRPGRHELPAASVVVRDGGNDRTLEARFAPVEIGSVLPADTANVQPRPAKDVLGADRVVWPLVVGGLLFVALLALGYWLYRRRPRPVAHAPAVARVSPRERALEALDHARSLGLVEAGEYRQFYSLVTDALRHYLAALDPAWGVDLTSTEVLTGIRRPLGMGPTAELAVILGRADLTKFARLTPRQEEVIMDWESARVWVETLAWPRPAAEQARAA